VQVAGFQVNPSTADQRITFEERGQHLQIDRERPKQRRGATPEDRLELIGQLLVAIPASLPQRRGAYPIRS
jgi:hypothetical protein